MNYFNLKTTIEELVDLFPGAIPLLSKYGIRCLICGEPSWGTLEETANEKGISAKELENIITDINRQYEIYKGENPFCGKL
ncbi:MAG: DUF1858 domain-containing protein [Ignavibacteria bacterium]|nr:DUF1858 domain-containing protein [Ignavibacteria bacterium]